jgi:hypothetical protein
MKIGTVAEANAAKRDIERIVKAWCDFRDGSATAAAATKAKRSTKSPKVKPIGKTAKRRPTKAKARTKA